MRGGDWGGGVGGEEWKRCNVLMEPHSCFSLIGNGLNFKPIKEGEL